jgi:hypothetical protein
MAAPKITGIQGGLGVTATVENAKDHDWQINIKGPFMISGMITKGTISSDSATIKAPALGFGKICIRVTVNRIMLPDIVAERCAFMLGPFVVFVHNAQCKGNGGNGGC